MLGCVGEGEGEGNVNCEQHDNVCVRWSNFDLAKFTLPVTSSAHFKGLFCYAGIYSIRVYVKYLLNNSLQEKEFIQVQCADAAVQYNKR